MRYILIFLTALMMTSPARATVLIKGVDVVTNDDIEIRSGSHSSVAVIFLSAKCPCSASHEVLLKNLSEKYPDVRFVGIHSNVDENAQETAEHFKASALPFSIIQDDKSHYANLWGALKTPHAFVLDKEGKVIYHGGVTDSHVGPSAKKQYLKEVLEDLQNGKPLRHKEGRALGCYIQRENS